MTREGGLSADEGAAGAAMPLAPEDVMRAELYALLAALLRAAPGAELLSGLTTLEGDESEPGRAVDALAHLAGATDPARAAREYHDLFVGVGRGELVPFGSYYLTGFLNEKPLGELRRTMRERGMERGEGERQPEDHIAALMEMMAGQITGAFGAPATTREQANFFAAHIGPWAWHFFKDLEGARSAVLYAPVGTIGRTLMEVEAQAFAME